MSKKLTHQEFVNKANIIHNNKYLYNDLYAGINISINITCCKHGLFKQSPHNHLNGSICPQCMNEQRSLIYSKGFKKFIEQANIIHNNKYKYHGVYKNTHTNIIIECLIHGFFNQKPIHHLHGSNCPACVKGANVSKCEIEWLDNLNISEKYRQKTLKINNKKIKVDAYDLENNTVYEFNGDYWHGNPKKYLSTDINLVRNKTFGELYQATINREKLLKEAGYNIVSIWEYDWNKFKNVKK